MIWQEISGSWLLIPTQPIGVVHFLGGAFVGTAPQLTYRWLLEQLAAEGYAVITTPFLNGFDHLAIARQVLNRFENILARLQNENLLGQRYLPIYGIGHSMGSKLHLLIGSLFNVERAGNILISFNNFPVKRSIPLFEQFELDQTLDLEFTPTPEETNQIILESYQIRRNLLIQFRNDTLDQTDILNPVLDQRFPNMIAAIALKGNHLTPLGQDFDWQVGTVFSPLDAIGQWMKQEFTKDLQQLKKEMCRWLKPMAN